MNSTAILQPGNSATSDWNKSDSSTNSANGPPDYYDYYDDFGFAHAVQYGVWPKRAVLLYQVAGIMILITGTFGNTMTILVLREMLSDASAFPLLFMALAVNDLVLLNATLLPRWIGFQFGYRIYTTGLVVCKLLSWLRNCLVSLSAWLLTAATVQRAMTILLPIQMRRMNARKQAAITIAVLVPLSVAFNSSYVYGVNVKHGAVCGWMSDQDPVRLVYDWLELLLNTVLPSVTMIVCNCLMIHTLISLTRRTRECAEQQADASRGGKRSQITLTLIVVSLVFVALTLPLHVTYFYMSESVTPWFVFWYVCAQLLWMCNGAVNFYLYILTGSRFRQVVKRMFHNARKVFSKTQVTGQTGLAEREMAHLK